ncbi:hypothetical protein, partial [Pantoea ananatis]|uniref:hypothetical protein n=1 Tax=Pantoea ananas TaxID=553 RepID=UPI0023AF2B8E
VTPFNPGERASRRLRREGRDFRGLGVGSLLLTLRGVFIKTFSAGCGTKHGSCKAKSAFRRT